MMMKSKITLLLLLATRIGTQTFYYYSTRSQKPLLAGAWPGYKSGNSNHYKNIEKMSKHDK